MKNQELGENPPNPLRKNLFGFMIIFKIQNKKWDAPIFLKENWIIYHASPLILTIYYSVIS